MVQYKTLLDLSVGGGYHKDIFKMKDKEHWLMHRDLP
jgi:hypothetical protein